MPIDAAQQPEEACEVAAWERSSKIVQSRGVGDVTPEAYRARGKGERIAYCVETAGDLGLALVACTARGVCAVLLGDDAVALQEELRRRFSAAELRQDEAVRDQLEAVLATLQGHSPHVEFTLALQGTAFQARVWAALRAIPRGQTRTYGQLATDLGVPKAVRAVAQACAANPVAVLVPCHRVLGADGLLTGYRWGVARKQALLNAESS